VPAAEVGHGSPAIVSLTGRSLDAGDAEANLAADLERAVRATSFSF